MIAFAVIPFLFFSLLSYNDIIPVLLGRISYWIFHYLKFFHRHTRKSEQTVRTFVPYFKMTLLWTKVKNFSRCIPSCVLRYISCFSWSFSCMYRSLLWQGCKTHGWAVSWTPFPSSLFRRIWCTAVWLSCLLRVYVPLEPKQKRTWSLTRPRWWQSLLFWV